MALEKTAEVREEQGRIVIEPVRRYVVKHYHQSKS